MGANFHQCNISKYVCQIKQIKEHSQNEKFIRNAFMVFLKASSFLSFDDLQMYEIVCTYFWWNMTLVETTSDAAKIVHIVLSLFDISALLRVVDLRSDYACKNMETVPLLNKVHVSYNFHRCSQFCLYAIKKLYDLCQMFCALQFSLHTKTNQNLNLDAL